MKIKRSIKALALLASILMLMGVVPALNVSAYYGCEDDFNYTRSDGEIKITGCLTKTPDVVIPEEINGYPVTKISDLAFLGCDTVVNLTLSKNVYEIGDRAFSSCSSLESITVSEYNFFYKSVDGVLFDREMKELIQYPAAKSGTEYIVPEGVEEIEETAFRQCDLVRITLPSSVKEIDYGAFEFSENLETIVIPEEVEKIDMEAFLYCTALKKLQIPASVRYIHNTALTSCTALEEIDVAKGNITYHSEDGILFHKNAGILVKYPAGKTQESYTIPDECTQIGEWAFSDCAHLKNIVLHENVRSIGQYAFWDCLGLESISIPRYVTWIADSVFFNCSSLKDVYYYGSESEWKEIEIEWGNEYFENATIHFENRPLEPTGPEFPEVTYLLGDANSDNKVNVKDATTIQKVAASLAFLGDVQYLAADCDGNGDVNVRDATAVQKYSAGIATGLSIGMEITA